MNKIILSLLLLVALAYLSEATPVIYTGTGYRGGFGGYRGVGFGYPYGGGFRSGYYGPGFGLRNLGWGLGDPYYGGWNDPYYGGGYGW